MFFRGFDSSPKSTTKNAKEAQFCAALSPKERVTGRRNKDSAFKFHRALSMAELGSVEKMAVAVEFGSPVSMSSPETLQDRTNLPDGSPELLDDCAELDGQSAVTLVGKVLLSSYNFILSFLCLK